MVTTITRPATQAPLAQQIARMDAGRLRAYRENLEFYQGRQWADSPRRRERRLTLNYAKTVIEKTASYTMSGLSFVVDPEDGSAEAAARARRAERALRDIQEANNLDQLEFDNEIDCSVLGDAAYKVTWDTTEKRVRVTAPDVQGLFVWPWGDDASRLWRVASRYVLGHEETEMLYGPLPDSMRTRRSEHTIVEVWTDADFELWIDGAPFESRENPYGFIPFVIYPNVREPKRDSLSSTLLRTAAAGSQSMPKCPRSYRLMRPTSAVNICRQPSQLRSSHWRFSSAVSRGSVSITGGSGGRLLSSSSMR